MIPGFGRAGFGRDYIYRIKHTINDHKIKIQGSQSIN